MVDKEKRKFLGKLFNFGVAGVVSVLGFKFSREFFGNMQKEKLDRLISIFIKIENDRLKNSLKALYQMEENLNGDELLSKETEIIRFKQIILEEKEKYTSEEKEAIEEVYNAVITKINKKIKSF